MNARHNPSGKSPRFLKRRVTRSASRTPASARRKMWPRIISILWWVLEIAIVALGIYAIAISNAILPVILWQLVVLTYLLLLVLPVWIGGGRLSRSADDSDAIDQLIGTRGWSWIFLVTASAMGAINAFEALSWKNVSDIDALDHVFILAAIGGVIQAWALLQVGFASVYATQYFKSGGKGLEFPGAETPVASDFFYHSFMIGTTFATSGVTVTSARMRRIVSLHSIGSFFYNAFFIAVALQTVQRLAS